MLCVDFEQLNRGAGELEDVGSLLFRMMEEITQLTERLGSVPCAAFEDEQKNLKKLAEELEEEAAQLQWLTKALKLIHQRYSLTGKIVTLRCENSCIAQAERKLRRVDLKPVRRQIDDITFI